MASKPRHFELEVTLYLVLYCIVYFENAWRLAILLEKNPLKFS